MGARVGIARADLPTPGYPEPIVQWGVQKGETCEGIAKVLYGSADHAGLVQRYNRVPCGRGTALPEGMTLVLPAAATSLPDARLRSMSPDVRVRPPGGGWSPAASGVPLYNNHNVNTLDKGRADIEFVDRSRVFLAPNTLVVIYGTASRTRVSKTPPPLVEVDSGEVKAGLAALRGQAGQAGQAGPTVEIALKGGGRVSAASRDAVVERKGERTTVAVFDGKADVSSAGKRVAVPKNFGTRFVGVAPPLPPRPLPPAPAWEAVGSGAIVLAPKEGGTLNAAWAPEPSAVKYRFEVSRDEAFHDLVVREEVPADIRAFRAERMPPGKYFMMVRAIDKEEYLGIAAATRAVQVVAADLDAGTVGANDIEANPYGVLSLAPLSGMEVSVDGGPFGPVPGALDLRQRAPKELRFRAGKGAPEVSVPVRYTPVRAAVTAEVGAGMGVGAGAAKGQGTDARTVNVRVTFEGLSGIAIEKRVAPSLRVRSPEGVRSLPLSPALSPAPSPVFTASFQAPEGSLAALRIDAVDGRGVVLGTGELPPLPPDTAPAPPPKPGRIGVDAPVLAASSLASFAWRSPTARSAAAAGVAMGTGGGGRASFGELRASGALGPVGIDASVVYRLLGDRPDSSVWLGGRWRALRAEGGRFELGPALRVSLPTAEGSPALRIEPAVLGGGALGKVTWLVNLGGRFRLSEDEGDPASDASDAAARAASIASITPVWQPFAILGATVEPLPYLRLYGALDGYVFGGGRPLAGGAGLTLGLEGGEGVLFAGIGGRVSPVNEEEQVGASVEFTIGLREPW
jgi:hypothetical protein